jgi:predicted house-cleaning noncanonical NTP pyrophosphatase (MazG superfamily)
MPVYHKLVRDRIPEIIQQSGKKCTTKILTDEEFRKELQKKMTEELNEYVQAESSEQAIEELADLLELIHALAKCHGSTIEEVEAVRKKKAAERGGFEEKIFLIEVEDEGR